MTKHVFVALLMMVVVVGSIQAQVLQPRRTLGGRRLQRPMDSAELLASATNESERAQIEQRVKNGELPEPLIPIEEALALAEKGDGKGYYQLAVRYAKGEGFDEDTAMAVKFLKKAYDLKYPRAIFAVALSIEDGLSHCFDKGNQSHEEPWPNERLSNGVAFSTIKVGKAFGFRIPYREAGSITNEVIVSFVRQQYRMADSLGMTAAKKELARIEKRITLFKKEQIDHDNALARDAEARKLIDANNVLARKLINDDNSIDEENNITERELWRSWPTGISDEEQMDIRAQTERKFNCVLMYDDHLSRSSTNSWCSGRGVSCILKQNSQYEGDFLQKIDASGKIVGVSPSGAIDYVVFEELKWLSDQENGRIAEHQEKWAKEHGMTLDEAKAKHAKWKEENPVGRPLGGLRRPGMLGGGSLRARRLQRQQEAAAAAAKQREEQSVKDAERQAQAEREKQQREAERAEQRQQLLAIQEELRRVREAKAAAEKK